MAESTRQLKRRWESAEGAATARAVTEALSAGRPLAELDLPTVDGRIDLRGIEFPAPVSRTARVAVEGLGEPSGLVTGAAGVRAAIGRPLPCEASRSKNLRRSHP